MDQDRDWAKRVAADVGKRVALYRDQRQISAQQLADRCAELGLPALSRIVIARLENGRRDAISTAEISVLAKALDMSPARLLFPLGLAAKVEVLPGQHVDTLDAAAWFAGEGDADAELLMTHRALLNHPAQLGEGPAPTVVRVGAMTEQEQQLWRQAVLGQHVLRQTRATIREHGLTPPQLPADLAWIEEQPVVAAVVTSAKGVLITKRNDGRPPWGFVSGEIEPGESPADAAVREVKEETGLRVQAGDIIGDREHPSTRRHMIYMAARPKNGTDEPFVGDPAELAEVRWATLAEADELLPGMHGPVHDYLARTLQRRGRR